MTHGEKRKARGLLLGIGLPLLIAGLMPVVFWRDKPYFGPHTGGALSDAYMASAAFLAIVLIVYAAYRRHWARVVAALMIFVSCWLCMMWSADWSYCPECDGPRGGMEASAVLDEGVRE